MDTGILAIGATALIVFVIIFLTSKTKTKKEVLFLRPRDKRGERLEVTRETDRSVLCEKSNPIHRFIKVGSAWTFKEGGKTSTRFFGIEGSAYTPIIKGGEEERFTLSEHLRNIWTDRIYEALPEKLRNAIERDKFGVIVDPIEINIGDYGLTNLSSDDVNDEGDAIVLNRLANQGYRENVKQKLLGNLIWLALGVGIAGILSNFGWF